MGEAWVQIWAERVGGEDARGSGEQEVRGSTRNRRMPRVSGASGALIVPHLLPLQRALGGPCSESTPKSI